MARNNECIEERKDSYRVKLSYYDELGNRKFYSKTFSVKKYGNKQKALEMAKRYRDEMKVRIANNMIVKEKHFSLDEVFQLSMELYECTLGTKKKLNGTYNKHIKSFVGGERDFSTIKYSDIQKSLNAMVSIAKNDTIQRTFTIWKRLYKNAIASEIVIKDETYNVVVPKSDLIEIKRKMETNINELFEVCNEINERIRNKRESILLQGALWIMYYTGMRPSEVFALHIDNIDMKNRNIFVCQSIGTTSKEIGVIRKTKNEYSIRNIPIVDELVDILKELIQYSKEGYLFVRNNNKFIDGTYLSDITRRMTKGAFRPYMLRHQFSTDLLNNGANPRTIQELMGHANPRMTIEYARSNDNLKKNALNNRGNNIKLIDSYS